MPTRVIEWGKNRIVITMPVYGHDQDDRNADEMAHTIMMALAKEHGAKLPHMTLTTPKDVI